MTRKTFVIVVRADPIVCGHSTEARNLAEAALLAGYEPYIVTWSEELLERSGLPLKPKNAIEPYSEGITILRPAPVGNYKILDGRYNLGMTSAIVDLASQDPTMEMTIMCLYLQPHASIVLDAVEAIRGAWGEDFDVTTIAEAVGSDVTNLLSNALVDGNFGAAVTVLTQFLAFDIPVCVSQFTLDEIMRHALEVDAKINTNFTSRIKAKAALSYPALCCTDYTELPASVASSVLAERQLIPNKYVLYLSRVIEAKGVFELVEGFSKSRLIDAGYELVIAGCGEALKDVQEVTKSIPSIRHITDVADSEKAAIFNGASAYVLPSKFHPTFVETFGIVITEAMLTQCGPVITCRTGGIPEATGDHCVYAVPGNSEKSGVAFDTCAESLREKLELVCLDMSESERTTLTNGAREYSLQFDRSNVFALLESKANAARSA
uniref:Glycosyl transferase family 1 domain-containing protein n=1 Tax=Florenciella parvula TaxID=236787 RepID=A0A7S2D5I3_9STRA|eukprot:CAMPEP_0182530028 /NCGR_PEP_ID=MMETSP1323-20130603/5607_1 /TAXON_ID=236787 /ORGANISM="Florenciella parvula, Strain RCC1693" /LENGTH=435 /DNA_ID=CAMNT_0024739291 /DNA_START=86 /DNA_END=1393 /DNA_ORIENTATION=-